jgi:hypothetical protein
MIEAQQQVIDAAPDVKPKAIRSDAALGRVRHMIERLVQQEQAERQGPLPSAGIPIQAG